LCAEEKMMPDDRTTVSDYLVLGTWEAITLLGQAAELCEADEISDMIAKAEAILISVVSELPRALADPAAPTRFDRTLPSLGTERRLKLHLNVGVPVSAADRRRVCERIVLILTMMSREPRSWRPAAPWRAHGPGMIECLFVAVAVSTRRNGRG
jgi:hypothetical protein